MKKVNAVVENLSMFSNYFELLGCEQIFDIDQDALHDNYIKLHQLFHPDKQVNKSPAEKIQAIEYASNLNTAYQILRNDKERAEYLLYLEGIFINREENNNIQPDPLMLNEIIELSEEPDIDQISDMQEECIEKFKIHYSNKELEEAAHAIIKLQYLRKIYIRLT